MSYFFFSVFLGLYPNSPDINVVLVDKTVPQSTTGFPRGSFPFLLVMTYII